MITVNIFQLSLRSLDNKVQEVYLKVTDGDKSLDKYSTGSFLIVNTLCRGWMFYCIFVFIHVYWCRTRFPCQMLFVSFKSNTTGVTSGAGIANPSGELEFTPAFIRVRIAWSFVFCEVFCRSLFVPFPFCVFCPSNLRILIISLVSSYSPYNQILIALKDTKRQRIPKGQWTIQRNSSKHRQDEEKQNKNTK